MSTIKSIVDAKLKKGNFLGRILKSKLCQIAIIFSIVLLCSLSTKTKAVENTYELYEIQGNCITRILPETTLKDLKNNMELDLEDTIQVVNEEGENITDEDLIGTGMTLNLGETQYKTSVIGDLNGDGKVTITDVAKLKLASVNLLTLENEYKYSADLNGDGKVSVTDTVKVNLSIVNLNDIIAPVTFIPTAERIENSIKIEGDTYDVNSGMKEYYFKLDDGEWVQNGDKTSSIYIFKNVTDDEHIVRMKVKDNKGNEKITEAIKIERLDNSKGAINIYPYTEELTNKDITIAVTYDTNISDAKKLISIDRGVTFEEYTKPIKVAKNTEIIARIENDTHGVIAEKSMQIENIDKLEPKEFTITATSTKQSITVNAETQDSEPTNEYASSGIKEYKYIIRNGFWRWEEKTQETTHTFNMLKKGENYTAQVIAIDNAGNEKASNEIEIQLKGISKLTINPNGGLYENSSDTQQFEQDEGTTKTIAAPTKEGYKFIGWELSRGGTLEGNLYTFGEQDGTLTAKWEINQYTLTLNPTGGTVGNGAPAVPGESTTITENYGTNITLPTPTKQYNVTFDVGNDALVVPGRTTATYTFTGWYTGATDGEKKEYTKMPANDETIYAHWDNISASITLPTPTKEGSTFEGWYLDSTFTEKIDEETFTPEENTILYANWTTNSYTLILNPTGGTVGVGVPDDPSANGTISADFGENITLPIPTKQYTLILDPTGGIVGNETEVVPGKSQTITATYRFIGWYTEAENGEERNYTKMPSADETLYAHWDNTNASIELPLPSKEGSTFVGWYKESSLTTKVGNSGEYYVPEENITLYAKWETNSYTLTLNPTGGTVGNGAPAVPGESTTITENYGTDITLPTPTKQYTVTFNTNGGNTIDNATSTYTFTGWYTGATEGVQKTYTKMPANNETLYAHWNSDGIELPLPTKEGYTFGGWYRDSEYTTKIGDNGSTYIPEENITLYAKWSVNPYTITLNPMGGVGVGVPDDPNANGTISAEFGEDITLPTPTKQYNVTFDVGNDALVVPGRTTATYTFTGWYTGATDGEKKEYTKMPSADETLYAHWDNTSASITLPTPTKEGYTFTGWYKDSAFTEKINEATFIPEENTTLYANWTINEYTLTFNANGGAVTPNTITANYNENITLPTPTKQYNVTFDVGNDALVVPQTITLTYTFDGWYVEGDQKTYTKMPSANETLYAQWNDTGAVITLPLPTKEGSTFEGWYKESSLTTKVGNSGEYYVPEENITLYAKWETNSYTLTLNPTGGTVGNGAPAVPGESTTITENYGTEITLPTPTKQYTVTLNPTGGIVGNETEVVPGESTTITSIYTFDGWYTQVTDGEKREYSSMPSSDETLYAHWDNSSASITLPTPRKTGCTFEGWYTDSELTTKINENTYTPTADITLYAKWEIARYTVTFDVGNDALVVPQTITENYGTEITLLSASKEGYRFAGWYSNSECTDEFKVGMAKDEYRIVEDITLYAKWDKLGIYVKLYSDGELVFTDTDRVLEGKTNAGYTVTDDYGNILDKDFGKTGQQDWYNERLSITSVDIVDKIQPISTAVWFYNCSNLTAINNIENLDTRKVTHMASVFRGCSSLTTLDLSNFDTSNVNSMAYMFDGCSSLTSLDLSSFDTSNVTNINNIFTNCTSLEQITFGANWNKEVTLPTPEKEEYTCTSWFSDTEFTNKVAEAGATYTPSRAITIYAGFAPNIYVKLYSDGTLAFTAIDRVLEGKTLTKSYGNVAGQEFTTTTQPWINERASITSVDIVDEIQPISTEAWFGGCRNLEGVNNIVNLDTSKVSSMRCMFWECNNLKKLDLSTLDTSNLTATYSMFYNCNSLTKINLSNFNTSKVNTMHYMFQGCNSLTELDLSSFETSNVTDIGCMFEHCSGLESLDLSSFDTSNVTSANGIFQNCSKLTQITFGPNWNKEVTLPTPEKEEYTCTGWFSDTESTNKVAEAGGTYTPNGATTIYANLVPSIYAKLYTDGTLAFTATDKTLSGKTVATDYGLIGGKKSGFITEESDIGSVKTVNFVDRIQPVSTRIWFTYCYNLTTINNISNLDTSKVTDMGWMFDGCSSLTSLDVSNFDTHNVTDMTLMFCQCSSLRSLDLSNFNTSNVTNMDYMFAECSSLRSLDLSSFDTSNVTTFLQMFDKCSSLTSLDLSSFDTRNVTRMDYMFRNCTNLQTIYVGPNWVTTQANTDMMFNGCNARPQTK